MLTIFNYIKNAMINHFNTDVNPKGLLMVYLISLNLALFISPYYPGSRWPLVAGIHFAMLLGIYGIYHNKQLKK
ncbi:hypothetical protein [Secundilactobacillus similis]|uniref:Uncharacterized protein n=1 Tax=Secundilactobacillus similis DSM 23365 = JCM 2765 TaxID=1423804 RepID=A0A0R2EPE2_9LACO|nr:hypothetical protein [Secundilactobacillus similis]KRN18239.1 hypothetical protein FD14_GL002103 [Secundilactobacillus similis DSM 23365 = JCM 2765]